MKKIVRVLVGVVLALGVGAVMSAQAKKLNQSDLPEAVQKTAAEQGAGGKVTAYWEREGEGGSFYEVDLEVDGHAKGVLIKPDGSLIAVQEEVAFDKLDPSVQESLKKQAGDGKIDRVFSVTRNGKVERYVAMTDNNGQKGKIIVGPDGSVPSEGTAKPPTGEKPPGTSEKPPATSEKPPSR
jgi:hypothetical protein